MSMKKFLIYPLTLLLIKFTPFSMAANAEVEDALNIAIARFDRAVDGDKNAVHSALQAFENLAKQSPDHPFLEARIGSLMTMRARDAWAPWNKMRYAEQGLDKIDRALERLRTKDDGVRLIDLPVSYDVYLTAASTFVALPKFFNRLGQAERLLRKLTEDAHFTETANGFQAAVWLSRAQVAQRQDHESDYKRYLKQALALDPNGKSGRQARSMLSKGD
jgi:tetratricopeptide (TPR) repeat protein